MATVLDTRLRQAQTEKMAPVDLVSALVTDELRRRQDQLLERRHKLARFRDPERSLELWEQSKKHSEPDRVARPRGILRK